MNRDGLRVYFAKTEVVFCKRAGNGGGGRSGWPRGGSGLAGPRPMLVDRGGGAGLPVHGGPGPVRGGGGQPAAAAHHGRDLELAATVRWGAGSQAEGSGAHRGARRARWAGQLRHGKAGARGPRGGGVSAAVNYSGEVSRRVERENTRSSCARGARKSLTLVRTVARRRVRRRRWRRREFQRLRLGFRRVGMAARAS